MLDMRRPGLWAVLLEQRVQFVRTRAVLQIGESSPSRPHVAKADLSIVFDFRELDLAANVLEYHLIVPLDGTKFDLLVIIAIL